MNGMRCPDCGVRHTDWENHGAFHGRDAIVDVYECLRCQTRTKGERR